MRNIIATLLLCLVAVGARAQPVNMPPGLSGFGTLSATNSSTALSTLTVGPNSKAWAMPFAGVLNLLNASTSAGLLYLCPFGGTCSATVGIPLIVGQSISGINLGGSTVSPTVFAVSTATVVAWW